MSQELRDRVDRVLRKIRTSSSYDSFDVNKIPENFYLTLSEVREVKKGKSLYIIEPQDYKKVTLLDKNNVMFVNDYSNSETGLFYRCGSVNDNIAVSGSGCDVWLVVRPDLDSVLDEIFFKKNYPSASSVGWFYDLKNTINNFLLSFSKDENEV